MLQKRKTFLNGGIKIWRHNIQPNNALLKGFFELSRHCEYTVLREAVTLNATVPGKVGTCHTLSF